MDASSWEKNRKYITGWQSLVRNRPSARSRHKITHVGTQVAQWDFQNKGRSSWTGTSCFVLEVPLCNLPSNFKNKQALNVTLLLAKCHILASSSCDGKLSFELKLSSPPPKLPRDFKTKLYSRKQITSIFSYIRQSAVIHCFAPFPTFLRHFTNKDVFIQKMF